MARGGLVITTIDENGVETVTVCDSAPYKRPIYAPEPEVLKAPLPVGQVVWVTLSVSGARVEARIKQRADRRSGDAPSSMYYARRVEFDGTEFGDLKPAKREQLSLA